MPRSSMAGSFMVCISLAVSCDFVVQQLVSSSRVHAQRLGQFGHPGDLLPQQLPLGFHLAGRHAVGHEGPVAVPAFEKPLGRQPLVNAKNRVLIDGQFGGQRPDGREPLAGLERSAGALGRGFGRRFAV